MANGNGINNRDKKRNKDKKKSKGKFNESIKSLFKKEPIITPSNSNLEEFTVESDGTSYKSSDKPKKSFKFSWALSGASLQFKIRCGKNVPSVWFCSI